MLSVFSPIAWAQLTVNLDDISQGTVGGQITASGSIVHDPTFPEITAGTPISLDLELRDPSGNPITTNPSIVFFGGFTNGSSEPFSQTFLIPWTQDDLFTPAARWTVHANVGGGGSPTANISFPLNIADLQITEVRSNTINPGNYVDLDGVLRNAGFASTEPNQFFRIEANIPRLNVTESIIFPDRETFPPGVDWPVLPGEDLNFTIPRVFIPSDVTGQVDVILTVDPGNSAIIPETNNANNTFNHVINVVSGDPNISVRVTPEDAIGTYQGLDPVKLKLVAKNIGNGPITNQTFLLTVALSHDNRFSQDDYVLRNINMGGTGTNALGNDLFINETVTSDWVQLLPDNFEGDFYILVSLNSSVTPIFVSETPEISLRSENTTDILWLTQGQANSQRNSRPSADMDGKMVTFESFENGFNQIYLQNLSNNQITRVTNGLNQTDPDGSSYAPKISTDGKFIVFHSFATNLVPGDNNNHSDIFIYNVFNNHISKISNSYDNLSSNEGSFYPTINSTATKIFFESDANNLVANNVSSSSNYRQIYQFDHNLSTGSGVISQVTNGNGDSFDCSVDGNGTRLVFTSHASNIVAGDDNSNSDVFLWDSNAFYLAGISESGTLPYGGATNEPVISLDGGTIAFQSSAPNMVSGRGISYIEIIDAGLGYEDNGTVLISDAKGTGALVSYSTNQYGEVENFTIDAFGQGYDSNATLSIAPDPSSPNPLRPVVAIPRLVNPLGDVFKIDVNSVIFGISGSTRISESQKLNGSAESETGGDERSREPSISADGSKIAYSTKASNLLDLNLTSTNQKVYPNFSYRPATARAILQGGIGKIFVRSSGSGYSSAGNLLIQDLTGNGSGAVVTFEVDSNGGIGSIQVVEPGSGYVLEQTLITVQNPGTGNGFEVGDIFFPAITGSNTGTNRQGGGSIHRIEMVDNGIGYPTNLHDKMEKPSILIDGDGVDSTLDGYTDARLNPDLLHFGANGEIYLEQHFELNVTNVTGLLSTTISISDYQNSLTLSFVDQSPANASQIRITSKTDEDILRDIRNSIRNQWGDDSNSSNLFTVPQITNLNAGSNGFTLMALSGSVTTDNPTALAVRHLSNMLVQGSGFTRATPQISPSPTIFGYSDINASLPTIASPNGRPLFHFQRDNLTDDIYLYDSATASNRRVSVTKFGFPTNYLGQANMSSHRYPSLSGDGRFIFFSSDAGGLGGLIFDNSNQVPVPANDNGIRDIFLVDLKDSSLPSTNYSIEIEEDFLISSNFTAVLNQSFPIHVSAKLQSGSIVEVRLYVNGNVSSNFSQLTPGTNSIQTFLPWQNSQLGPHNLQVSVVDNINNEYFSEIYQVSVVNNPSSIYSTNLEIFPTSPDRSIFIRNPIFEDTTITLPNGVSFTSNEFLGNYEIIGPFNDGNVSDLLARGGVTNIGLAEAYFSTEDPTRARPLSSVYPFRQTNTQGSSLSAKSTFIGINGKEAILKNVSYFLNGKLIDEQIHPPYFTYFSPPALSDDNLTALDGWTLTSMATDLNDNIRIDTQLGEIFFSEIFPNLELIISSGITDNQNQILDGQIIKLSARASGDFTQLDKLQQVHFFVNGTQFSSSFGNPILTSDGNLDYIDYNASLDIDFSRYAKPDGSLSIIVFGEMEGINGYIPNFRSNTINLKITTPMPWVDEESNVLSLFEDLTRRKPDANEVAYTMEAISQSSDGIAHWIESLLDFGAVSDRIDVVSAHRVIFGEWHSEYEQFEEDSLSYIGRISPELTALNFGNEVVDPFWLKEYISDLLISEDYTFKFIRLPFLVGSYFSSNVINYQDNRHEFIRRHFKNKYGTLPNIAQLYQGSYKMLQWWESFEPEYWELPNGTKPDQALAFNGFDPDSPPRRDQFVPLPSTDVTGGGTGNIRFTYEAGEIAVDFIYNLSKEPEFFEGVPYLLETSRLRENQFTIATLMHLLWQKNADVLSDGDVNSLVGLSLKEAIKAILGDYRYTSRHNIIWRESEILGTTFPNWKKEDWFGGSFMDKNFPWIYHEDLEWIFIAGVSRSSFWFYSEKLGWVWTGSSYYPYLYSKKESSWIYFYDVDNPLNPTASSSSVQRYLYIQKSGRHIPYDSY